MVVGYCVLPLALFVRMHGPPWVHGGVSVMSWGIWASQKLSEGSLLDL